MLGRLVNEQLRVRPPEYPWGDTLPFLERADVRICNLECVLSDGGSPARKVFTFRSDAKNIASLEVAGIDAVILANNHSLDYGPEALADTLGLLDQAGIRYTGAGTNLKKAEEPLVIKSNAKTIMLIAATDTDEPGWAAEKDTPGVWSIPIDVDDQAAEELFRNVRDTKPKADVLIVSLHWGSNWGHTPEKGHREFAHALIDAGADIVFGHSSHVYRGIEFYKGRPIIYSAGDFIDDYAVDEAERNDESFIFIVDVDTYSIRMHPTIIRDFQARMADQGRAARIAAHMANLCRYLGTTATWIDSEKVLEIV